MAAGSLASPSVDRPAKSPSGAVSLVGGGLLPVAFMAAGLTALATAVTVLLIRPALWSRPYVDLDVVALVHLWLPGFLLSVAFGAIYQLAPVILGEPLKARVSALWIHFVLHITGTVLLIAGFFAGRFTWVGVGGTLISLGILSLTRTVFRTFRLSQRRDTIAWSLPLASAWLLSTVIAGVLTSAHFLWDFLPFNPVALLKAHAHLGLLGFFLTLLQGVTFQLVPMFTMGEIRRPRLIGLGLAGTQVALFLLIPGFAVNSTTLISIGAAVQLFALFASGISLVSTLRSRRRRVLEPGIKAFSAGATLIPLAATLAAYQLQSSPASSFQFGSAYGWLLIGGALTLTVLGFLNKILPFLVWMRAYGPRVGKQPVPLAPSLSSPTLERLWLGGHLVAIACGLVAILSASPVWSATASAVLAAASSAYLTNAARVLLHLTRTPRPSTAPA